jgi:hypothetical protein
MKCRIGNTHKFEVKDLKLHLKYERNCPMENQYSLQGEDFLVVNATNRILIKDGLHTKMLDRESALPLF